MNEDRFTKIEERLEETEWQDWTYEDVIWPFKVKRMEGDIKYLLAEVKDLNEGMENQI